jgi:hypothetical protein
MKRFAFWDITPYSLLKVNVKFPRSTSVFAGFNIALGGTD